MLSCVLCLSLAACADDDSQRRFATDPEATEAVSPTATVESVAVDALTPTGEASPVSISDLFTAGGNQTIAFHVGSDLVAIQSPWDRPRPVWTEPDGRIVASAVAPSGDRIAVLRSPTEDSTEYDLVVVDPNGVEIARQDSLDQLVTGADRERGQQSAGSLTWSPDGTQIAVALPTGGIVAVPLEGAPVILIKPNRLPAPGQIAWSPQGDALAFIAPAGKGDAAALSVAATGAVPLDPIEIVPASRNGRRTISHIAWQSDSETLLYTTASTSGDLTFGGDLFAISSGGGDARLIAGASRVGPVSAITNFAISPDGQGVAYVVTMPEDDGGSDDSLWVQPLDGSTVYELAVPADQRVTDIAWSSDGFAWLTAPSNADDAGEITLSLATVDGQSNVVYQGPAIPVEPGASPEASPAALASPIADAATPEGSPASTPVADEN